MITRKAVLNDLPQLQVMYKNIIEHMQAESIYIWDDVYPCICFREDIEQKQLYILQEDTDILAAFALCGHNDGEHEVSWQFSAQRPLYLDRLGVHADHMGAGMGSMALKEALQCAKEAGADALRLFVVDCNTPAIRLYEKNGFNRAAGVFEEIIDETLTLQELGFEKVITGKGVPCDDTEQIKEDNI